MEQTIGVERLYTLGNYKNIKLSDIITNIPKELINNSSAQGLLRMLQFIRLDKSHIKYRILAENVYNISYEDALVLLDNLEKDTIDSLKNILTNGELDIVPQKELEV
jgi:hypothetical protein